MKWWILSIVYCMSCSSCLPRLDPNHSIKPEFTPSRVYAEIILRDRSRIKQKQGNEQTSFCIYSMAIDDLAHLFTGYTIGEILTVDEYCMHFKPKPMNNVQLDTSGIESFASCDLYFIDTLPRPWKMWKEGPSSVYVFSPVQFGKNHSAYVRVFEYSYGWAGYEHIKLSFKNGKVEFLPTRMKKNSILGYDCSHVALDEWWWGMDRSQ